MAFDYINMINYMVAGRNSEIKANFHPIFPDFSKYDCIIK